MASIAEMERNTLFENVKLGMTQRAKEGSWNGGVVLGYDSIEKERLEKPHLHMVRSAVTLDRVK
jgi:site-specific DNA recombinase